MSETCHYCGHTMHPMLVWTNQATTRYACDKVIQEVMVEAGIEISVEPGSCAQKAKDDGFIPRWDLTSKR